MTVDFSKLLSIKADDIQRPKPLPAGSYYGIIKKFKFDETRQKKTAYVRFEIAITSAGVDIAPEDLEGIDLGKKQMYKDFYLTDDSFYRLTDFIASCGIPTAGRDLNSMIPDLLEQPVMLDVTQRANPEDMSAPPFNDVGKVVGQGA